MNLTAARVSCLCGGFVVFKSPKLGIPSSANYPSMGISHFLELSLLCSRFLSYIFRMNFELVFTMCEMEHSVSHVFCTFAGKLTPMFKASKVLLFFFLLGISLESIAQSDYPDDFRERYALKQVVVLSRHNIRSPLSGRHSMMQRITPHEWYQWSSAPSELSLRGGALETMMGQYFRKWLVSEGLMRENEIPAEGTMRFYANSLQRTIATAQYFSSGMLPVANIRIEHHLEVGKMDSVFAPQITDDNEVFKALAQQQITAMGGKNGMVGIGERMADNYKVLEQVLDMNQSKACLEGDTCHFRTDDAHVYLNKHREPGMGGSLRLACQAADALILQYYEEPDAVKAAFGDMLTWKEWESISAIKDWYGDVLFTAPVVARQVARPLLRTMLEELQAEGRKFTFLCGHDSNMASVLAALEAEEYSLPNTIEKKTPIGCKLVIEKREDTEGQAFVTLNLVYQSTEQLRSMSLLDLENPPMVFPIRLKGLNANADGLYMYEEFLERIMYAIQ
jgi:glucose-1-phosphatase